LNKLRGFRTGLIANPKGRRNQHHVSFLLSTPTFFVVIPVKTGISITPVFLPVSLNKFVEALA